MTVLLGLELEGLPPTVNHIYRSARRGFWFKTASCVKYQEEVSNAMRRLWDKEAYDGRVSLNIKFTVQNRRKWDRDNRVKALQDCLELACVIKNDSQIDELHVKREHGEVSKTSIKLCAYQR